MTSRREPGRRSGQRARAEHARGKRLFHDVLDGQFKEDSYDSALAESSIGLFKTEVIRQRGPWRSLEAVEFAALEWVDWFNNRWLLEWSGRVPPAEAEAAYYARTRESARAA